jgi:ribosomal protein S18 acetylase RimI-like enzyme
VRWRNATPADAPLMARIDASLAAHLSALVGLDAGQRQALLSMQTRAREQAWRTAWPDAHCQVIELDDAATAGGIGRLWLHRGSHAWHLLELVLVPERRGAGIGGQCLRRLVDLAQAEGVGVTLSVAADNPAHRLYRRLGFQLFAENPPYLHMSRDPHPPSFEVAEVHHEQA